MLTVLLGVCLCVSLCVCVCALCLPRPPSEHPEAPTEEAGFQGRDAGASPHAPHAHHAPMHPSAVELQRPATIAAESCRAGSQTSEPCSRPGSRTSRRRCSRGYRSSMRDEHGLASNATALITSSCGFAGEDPAEDTETAGAAGRAAAERGRRSGLEQRLQQRLRFRLERLTTHGPCCRRK